MNFKFYELSKQTAKPENIITANMQTLTVKLIILESLRGSSF